MGKDTTLKAMTDILYQKGEENQRLAEMISEFKNQHLVSEIFGKKYAVVKSSTISADEQLMESKFELQFYQQTPGNLFFSSQENLKTWKLKSRHVIELLDIYTQIMKLMDAEERQLEKFYNQNQDLNDDMFDQKQNKQQRQTENWQMVDKSQVQGIKQVKEEKKQQQPKSQIKAGIVKKSQTINKVKANNNLKQEVPKNMKKKQNNRHNYSSDDSSDSGSSDDSS
eukprot:403351654